jgi:leucyl-tRNA synthetase
MSDKYGLLLFFRNNGRICFMKYDFKEIEERLAKKWEKDGVYKTVDRDDKKKTYVLGMFPYPSGDGLHTGHVRIYTATDVLARFMRMKGREVLYPVGWDAFGLPAENAAIKMGTNPMEMVPKHEANFKRQMQMMGLSYDWDKTFSTTSPEYYKWTQWLFLKLYGMKNSKGERLVYRKEVPIKWCPFCKTGLANEEVLASGIHERCGKTVEEKSMFQWVMRITDYSDRLLYGLDDCDWVDEDGNKRTGLDWPEGIKQMQRSWVGRKEGVKVRFKIADWNVDVFTTRLDTIYGVTFVVVAPEVVKGWVKDGGLKVSSEVEEYIKKAMSKGEQQRQVDEKEKTGVKMKLTAVNPVNGSEIPVFVADYVLKDVGTGVVMGVPAHDERDRQFAEKYNLDIIGTLKDKDIVFKQLKKKGLVEKSVNYHLRDWVFSRQRYWGEPFPLIYCEKCGDENGVVVVEEKDLPVKLPELKDYEPTDTGESPLSRVKEWVEVKCPKCDGKAKRETDTMPNWAGSCWYFLRFADPVNTKEAWSRRELDKWSPVDWYLGGAEHAVLHLLYARFWVKAFFDLGLLGFEEPFLRLRSVGMVLSSDGRKMSKSWGNVINPDGAVEKYGADALRIYEMFMGPWGQAISWDERSLVGCFRFLEKFWKLAQKTICRSSELLQSDGELVAELSRVVDRAGKQIVQVKFNTLVASLMEFVNSWGKSKKGLAKKDLVTLLKILAPLAPFMAEELWYELGEKESVHLQKWPEMKVVEKKKQEMAIQVNGKLRDTITLSTEQAKEEDKVVSMALKSEKVRKWVGEGEGQKVIFVSGRLVNFVV